MSAAPDARLDCGLWEGRVDGVRKALEAVNNGDKESSTPRLRRLFITDSQNLAPSLLAIHSPKTSRPPSGVTPRAT